MTADDLSALNEQIAAMSRAGLPLDQGLASLAREMGRGRLRTVTEALANDLRAGHPLPEALARQEGRIPPYYANLVTAGLKTGQLPEVLTTLTIYAKSVAAVRTIVIEALLYPAVVLIIGMAIFTALAVYILPQFEQIFNDFGMKLPDVTEFLLLFGRYPIQIIVIPTAIFVVCSLGMYLWARYSLDGRLLWVRAVNHMPLIGPLVRSARQAAFADLLAMLVEYGVPLPLAFRLAGGASSNPDMAIGALEVEERLGRGVPLIEAVRGRGLVSEWAVWLAAAGENRNALAPALREIATVYRRQVDTRSAILRSVLPPLVVIVTAGSLVTFFAIGIMSPMIYLLEGLSK